eukprot:CAMPEP_0201879506 /NCGR_PEP_ID=MMETSP0902-20130614/10370_1 /ASSEMBLY_ACC=CAM_ASM_000551 /TAXON_ID=420261 /ORGANISM="Thalassiosira antarctica, Strain CCMP982" /LENGTH=218 /DNA_ID=CAMNT_0048407345 /DNA_START=65 /DNA_END=721 /DNA_ORIENTATION=-
MKLHLLKMTALALVATPGVYALDEPQALRGFAANDNVLLEVEASCEDGSKEGQKQVDQLWRKAGRDCDNAWNLKKDSRKMKERNFRNTSRTNWRTKSYNRCAQQGVDDAVQRIEKKCFEDDSSQCTGLGEAAAKEVVMQNFCSPGFASQHHGEESPPNYKRECKKAAYSICEGQIPTVANRWCNNKSMSTSKMRDMQGKCKKQVNKMVDGDEFVFVEE